MNRIWRKIKNRFRRHQDVDDEDDEHDNDRIRDLYAAYLAELELQRPPPSPTESIYGLLPFQFLVRNEVRSSEDCPLPPAVEDPVHASAASPPVDQNERQKVSPKAAMRRELSCPVCGDFYTDPVISPCLHSFCSSCAQTLVSSDSKGKCPVCKEEITYEGLKKNYPLKGIVDIFSRRMIKQIGKKELRGRVTPGTTFPKDSRTTKREKMKTATLQAIKCDLCRSRGSVGWFCVQCEVTFCKYCLDGLHPTLSPDHDLIVIRDGVPSTPK